METSGTRISSSLWLSIVIILAGLGAAVVIYAWQLNQVIVRTKAISDIQVLEQAVLEMRRCNSVIAQCLADYSNSQDRESIGKLRNEQAAFDRAALAFNQFARNDNARAQSREISSTFVKLRNSSDEVILLVDQKQAALFTVRTSAKESSALLQGMIAATIKDGSTDAQLKLGLLIEMGRRFDDISTGLQDYARIVDPDIRRHIQSAREEFARVSSAFKSSGLTPVENSWVQHVDGQVEKLLNNSAGLIAITDSLALAEEQFQLLSGSMDEFLANKVQPLVLQEKQTESDNLAGAVASGGVWLIVLLVLACLAGLGSVLIISRRITGPIHQMLSGISLIAGGRIEHRFNTDNKGELGQLALGLNKMLDNLKRSRDALGESEELAWMLLDATHDAVILTDLHGLILASNEIAAGRFDRSLEQMVDESIYDLLPAESAALLKAHVAELMRTRKPVHYEDEREGKIIEHDIYPVSEHRGEITRIAFFSRDVTMRKWVEDVTEQLARRNTLILESAGEGIFGLDSEGKTTFVNPSAARMHGYKPEELVGKKHHDLVHHSRPDGKLYPSERCPIHATLKDGSVHSNIDDEVFWRKDGTSFQVEYTSTPIMQQGRIMGAVITFRDISDRKRVERALRESEEKYRSVAESAASLIIWLDREGKITDSSPRIEKFLGYTADEVIGHPFLELVLPDDHTILKEAMSITARDGMDRDHHFRMLQKNHGMLEVSMNTAVTSETNGAPVRIICMISATGQRVHGQSN